MNPFGSSFGSSFGRMVIYVLTTTLFFSSWAAADLSCRSQSEPASHHVQHAAHGSAAIADQDAGPSTTDCPCCDDCAMLCPAMGGTALAALTTAGEQPYDSHARLTPQTVNFRPQPPPQSLFRPPIS
jgi:hypothetical protein